MTRVESLEQQVQALSPDELAKFRAGFLHSTGRPGTSNSSLMFEPGGSMPWQIRHSAITPAARRRPFEDHASPSFWE